MNRMDKYKISKYEIDKYRYLAILKMLSLLLYIDSYNIWYKMW